MGGFTVHGVFPNEMVWFPNRTATALEELAEGGPGCTCSFIATSFRCLTPQLLLLEDSARAPRVL